MKSVSEIHDMIQTSPDYSPRTAGIFEILEAMLELIGNMTPLPIRASIAEEAADLTKPHAFILDKDHGTYRVCKCGISEGNKTWHP